MTTKREPSAPQGGQASSLLVVAPDGYEDTLEHTEEAKRHRAALAWNRFTEEHGSFSDDFSTL